ncbi:MAG: hypothetical protein WD266_11560 [Balneolales bacterium]
MALTARKLSVKPQLSPMLKTVSKPPNRMETDLFDLFGWGQLPFDLKNAIVTDLAAYRDELLGLYSTRNTDILDRRKSVAYWVNNYLSGCCSLETAIEMLEVNS